MNDFYRRFIAHGIELASLYGLQWDLPIDAIGKIPKTARWSLTALCGQVPPPELWHSTLSFDSNALEGLNALREQQHLETIPLQALSPHWRNFYQAVLLNELISKKNKPSHALLNIGRPLRIIATCAYSEAPWELTAETIQRAYNVALGIGSSGKVAANLAMVIRMLIDDQHIADRSPLSRFCKAYATPTLQAASATVARLKHGNNTFRHTSQVRSELSERKGSTKLPDEMAFWEMVRIVFTVTPKTFADAIRFNQIKVAIACGFRVGENVLLPADWARWHEYMTTDGLPAGVKGGVSRSLSIRNFAEKQDKDKSAEGIVLYENAQHVPALFESIIIESMEQTERLTKPLRERLRLQCSTGRFLPELELHALIPAWDIYTRISGSLHFISQPLPSDLVAKYRKTFDLNCLDEMRKWQIDRLPTSSVSSNCTKYFKQLPITLRHADGSAHVGKVNWQDAYLRVSEVEDMIRKSMPTKHPEVRPFLLPGRKQLSPAELMFLMPIRALIEDRNGGLLDVNRYFSIGRASASDLQLFLGGKNSIFMRYGETDIDRMFSINPHSLRHLQNAELFRLGIADTIITKRFNRNSVAQSHVYDHRSLREDLAHIELPAGADVMGPRAQEALQMIMAKKIRGPIVDEFLKVQQHQGDDEAFRFLSAEAEGLHVTPYGFCVNSFTVDPCPKHLECYNGCRHLTRSQVDEEQQNLETLKQRMISVVQIIECSEPQKRSIGWQNQLRHAQDRLENLDKVLSTPAGNHPFPDGQDLYRSVDSMRGTSILDRKPAIWSPE